MAVSYTIDFRDNKATVTQFDGDVTLCIWGINGTCQLRATSFTSTDAEYRVSQAGVQDIVMNYSEITDFDGESPTADPIADFSLLQACFPSFAPVPAP